MATPAAKDNNGDDQTSKAMSPAAQETSPKPYNFFNSKDRKGFPVPRNGDFDTLEFLDSVSDFILINDYLGALFSIVKKDMSTNIAKIREVYNRNPTEHKLLKNLLQKEKENKGNSAASALLWLKRGLEFCVLMMDMLLVEAVRDQSSRKELNALVFEAYEQTLKKYHGWFTRGMIKVAAQTLPSRATASANLCVQPDGSAAKEIDELVLYTDGATYTKPLSVLVNIINEIYTTLGLDSEERVN